MRCSGCNHEDFCLVSEESYHSRVNRRELCQPTNSEKSTFRGWLRRRGQCVEEVMEGKKIAKIGPRASQSLRILFVRRWILEF